MGPKIDQNSNLCSLSQKVSIGFALVLVYKSIWANFRGVLNISLRGPISMSFMALKYIIIQVFRHFLKTVFQRCIAMTSPYDPISGFEVNIAVELIRPWDLLLDIS